MYNRPLLSISQATNLHILNSFLNVGAVLELYQYLENFAHQTLLCSQTLYLISIVIITLRINILDIEKNFTDLFFIMCGTNYLLYNNL